MECRFELKQPISWSLFLRIVHLSPTCVPTYHWGVCFSVHSQTLAMGFWSRYDTDYHLWNWSLTTTAKCYMPLQNGKLSISYNWSLKIPSNYTMVDQIMVPKRLVDPCLRSKNTKTFILESEEMCVLSVCSKMVIKDKEGCLHPCGNTSKINEKNGAKWAWKF